MITVSDEAVNKIRSLLEREGDLEVTAEAAGFSEALAHLGGR